MDSRRGTFIVIEGTDGSGKGTQFQLLKARLESQGYDVATFDFPQYDMPSSYFVRQYLNGKFGTLAEVGPYTASLFYALDRYEAAPRIRKALDAGKIVISNRFTGSSMGHQGTKFRSSEERRGYFIWLDNLEFEMLRIPRPDMSFVLRVPAEIAQNLVDQKEQRNYTTKKRDLHEADLNHLQQAVAVFDDLTQLFPKDFQRIDCVRDDQLLSVEVVQELVWQKVRPLLPEPQSIPAPSTGAPLAPVNPYLTKTSDGQFEITAAGREFLSEAVTNTEGDVYAFTNKLSPTTIAAAMARLSRRGDDMRVVLVDEFATAQGKDEQLLQRVITAYGDDSVQQLAGLHVVFEKASNLLTKKLEWGRLAAYLEQSTRYIYYDQRDRDGHYKYYVPEGLPAMVQTAYRAQMDDIFGLYSRMVHQLSDYIATNTTTPKAEQDAAWRNAVRAQACDAIRPVLPTATQSTVGMYASGQALESLITHLLADDLPEAQQAGTRLLTEARKVIPTFLERADRPDRGGAAVAYTATTRKNVERLAQEYLPANHATETNPVQLTDIWPRNELELVPDMLYAHSSLPLAELRQEVETWPYDRKLQVFTAYMGERLNRRHKPGRALEKAHYSWDIICDYGIFRDLQRHRMVDDLEWQILTPRYGYEIPKLVEEAGLTDDFEACFDRSLSLYSLLQQAGYPLEAQYATLLGHKMRWKVTYNARQAFHIHELRTSPQGHPGYRKLVREMHEKLSEAHPLLGEAMRFVNEGEDPELTRLAAERSSQFKLDRIDSTTSA